MFMFKEHRKFSLLDENPISYATLLTRKELKEGKGREGKGREGKGREGKGRARGGRGKGGQIM